MSPARFERAAPGLGNRCSILLSYGDNVAGKAKGIEGGPSTDPYDSDSPLIARRMAPTSSDGVNGFSRNRTPEAPLVAAKTASPRE